MKMLIISISTIDVGSNPSCIAIDDLNHDGHQDVVVGHATGAAEFIMVLVNNGNGTRFSREDHPVSDDPSLSRNPCCVIAADLDDGGADIVAASGIAYDDMILSLMSNGAFNSPQHRRLPVTPSILTASDFDEDGNLDLAVIGGTDGGKVLAIRNQKDLSPPYNEFSGWGCESFLTHISAKAIATGDFNEDGAIDVAVASNDGVAVLHNNGIWGSYLGSARPLCVDDPQRFERAIKYDIFGAQALAVADVDQDGDLDIVLPLAEDNTLAIIANRGGSFVDDIGRLRVTNFPVQDGPSAIFEGDLDGDGRIEIAVANKNSNDVWVIHKRSSPVNMPFECLIPRAVRRFPEVP